MIDIVTGKIGNFERSLKHYEAKRSGGLLFFPDPDRTGIERAHPGRVGRTTVQAVGRRRGASHGMIVLSFEVRPMPGATTLW